MTLVGKAYKPTIELDDAVALANADLLSVAQFSKGGSKEGKVALSVLKSFVGSNVVIGDKQVAVGGPSNNVVGIAGFEFDNNNLKLPGDLTVNDTLLIGGGLKQAVKVITAATYTILKTDFMIFADTTTQAITLTLPAIVSGAADDGRMFRIQKVFNNTNSLKITPQSPSKINSEASDTITGLQNDALTYMASGGDWFIINRDTTSFGVIQQLTPGTTQGLTLTLAKLAVFDTDTFETPGVLTADSTNDLVSVDHSERLSVGGDAFLVEFMVEISNYSNNQEIFCEVFIDGVAANIQDVQQTSNAFNTVLKARGLRRVLAPKNIELRIAASNVSTATFETCELIVERVGK